MQIGVKEQRSAKDEIERRRSIVEHGEQGQVRGLCERAQYLDRLEQQALVVALSVSVEHKTGQMLGCPQVSGSLGQRLTSKKRLIFSRASSCRS